MWPGPVTSIHVCVSDRISPGPIPVGQFRGRRAMIELDGGHRLLRTNNTLGQLEGDVHRDQRGCAMSPHPRLTPDQRSHPIFLR